MSNYNDKHVYITGGSSGIGLALAKYYVRAGAHVVLIARNQSKLDSAISELRLICPSDSQRVEGCSVDVADTRQLQAQLQHIQNEFGVPDLLITSAGQLISQRFDTTSSGDFDRLMQTNFSGSRDVVQALLPAMIKRRKGHIVFIASMAGLVSGYGYTAYNASKYALIGFAGALRQELRENGIRVSAVCPPEVDTPMVAQEAETILPQSRLLKDLCGTLQTGQVVSETVKGITRNRALIVPGFRAKATYLLARLMPNTFMRVVDWLLLRIAV